MGTSYLSGTMRIDIYTWLLLSSLCYCGQSENVSQDDIIKKVVGKIEQLIAELKGGDHGEEIDEEVADGDGKEKEEAEEPAEGSADAEEADDAEGSADDEEDDGSADASGDEKEDDTTEAPKERRR